MHVVDFSRNHWGEAGTLHPSDEARPKKAPGRIEHPGCCAQALPITANVACGGLNDLHAVASDDIRQKRWRRGFTFGHQHGRNVEFTGPYMHDGRLATLEAVIDHYSRDVKPHVNLDGRVRRRGNFTASQKAALVAFLKTLSDRAFLTDPKFSDPFQ